MTMKKRKSKLISVLLVLAVMLGLLASMEACL